MQTAFYIFKKIILAPQKSFSRFITRLAIAATAISVAAMLIATAFVNGFQEKIANKVFDFWGHIRIQHYQIERSLINEELPIQKNDTVENGLKNNPFVAAFHSYSTKAAVAEKNKLIEGVLFKGIDMNSPTPPNFQDFIRSGKWFSKKLDSNYIKEILVSHHLAEQLNLTVGDLVKIHFVSSDQLSAVYRSLKVIGIFKTGVEEYDKLFVVGDISLLQKINGWDSNTIGGYEVFLFSHKQVDSFQQSLNLPPIWASKSIQDQFPSIFDWLHMQDLNKHIIYVIMGIVAIINLITCLLIIILERINTVGILKALGMPLNSLRMVFIFQGVYVAFKGIVIGTILGLLLCWMQLKTGLIRLDETSYFVSIAPVKIIWWQVGSIILTAFFFSICILIIPSYLVKKISVVKAIQFK